MNVRSSKFLTVQSPCLLHRLIITLLIHFCWLDEFPKNTLKFVRKLQVGNL